MIPHHDPQADLLSIIHDVKNVLFRVSALADLMMEESKGGDMSGWSIPYPQLIVQCCRASTDWINTVTDLARLEADGFVMQPEVTDLVEVVRQWAGINGALAQAGQLRFRCLLPPHALPVRLDARYFVRVLDNLYSNAVKFTPEGGQVTLAARQEGHGVQVSVSDTGVGIPRALLPHVFNKFSMASREGQRGERSSGLGLYTARQIVENHGGALTVQSEEAQGTTFTVSLPRFPSHDD